MRLSPFNASKTNFLENLVTTDRSAIKRYTKQNPNIKNQSAGARENQINVGGSVHLCSALVDAELASGAKRITLRGTFSTSHLTRRNGLSSWRVIFFVAAGMLSGKLTANYVIEIFGKVDF